MTRQRDADSHTDFIPLLMPRSVRAVAKGRLDKIPQLVKEVI